MDRQTNLFEYFASQSSHPPPPTTSAPTSSSASTTTTPVWGPYQPTLEQLHHRNYGANALQQASTNGSIATQTFNTSWREPARPFSYGGSGQDEITSTATARNTLQTLQSAPQSTPMLMDATSRLLSQNRVGTDSLVWVNSDPSSGDTSISGHPGALRTQPHTNHHVSTGHGSRDISRATAFRTEYQSLAPPSDSSFTGTPQAFQQQTVNAMQVSNARTGIETLARMSAPYQTLMAQPLPTSATYHARHGDISQAANFQHMAAYVHNERERLRWDVAGQTVRAGQRGHVPQVMLHYLDQARGDHHLAMQAFLSDAAADRTPASSHINTSPLPQAISIPNTTTMANAPHLNRALSDPRLLV